MAHRYASLNLLQNPFSEATPADALRLADLDLQPIRTALDNGFSVQLVGRRGRGKTTRLKGLAFEMGCPYVRVLSHEMSGDWVARPPAVAKATSLLVLDEADFLLPPVRILLLRRVPAVVLASHYSLALSMRLAGHRVVTITVGGVPSVRWLHRVLNARIAYYRMANGPVPTLTKDDVSTLIRQHGDDLRGMEEQLFDTFQARTAGN